MATVMLIPADTKWLSVQAASGTDSLEISWQYKMFEGNVAEPLRRCTVKRSVAGLKSPMLGPLELGWIFVSLSYALHPT